MADGDIDVVVGRLDGPFFDAVHDSWAPGWSSAAVAHEPRPDGAPGRARLRRPDLRR
jgi:hypothetical protein